jgi:Notch-like protein
VQPCNPIYDAYCQSHYANGRCDDGCNNAECNWDGLDCENEPSILALGSVSMVLEMDLPTFKNMSVAFVRSIGRQLRTTVRIKLDQQVILVFDLLNL